jgi:hypothetical protein
MFAMSAEFETPPAANCGTPEMKAHSLLEKKANLCIQNYI